MKMQITVGSAVQFDSEHGPQTGMVAGITRDIGNAQGYAIVEIDHELPGILWNVPMVKLQLKTKPCPT